MSKSSSKMASWQVFHYARKHLSRSLLYAMFGKVNARTIDRWCENPLYTSRVDGAYDPIKGVRRLLMALDDTGHSCVVRAAMAYLSSGTCCDMDIIPRVDDLLPTIEEELLADFRSVSDLQRAIEDSADIVQVEALKLAAIQEIERTVARYRKDCSDE